MRDGDTGPHPTLVRPPRSPYRLPSMHSPSSSSPAPVRDQSARATPVIRKSKSFFGRATIALGLRDASRTVPNEPVPLPPLPALAQVPATILVAPDSTPPRLLSSSTSALAQPLPPLPPAAIIHTFESRLVIVQPRSSHGTFLLLGHSFRFRSLSKPYYSVYAHMRM